MRKLTTISRNEVYNAPIIDWNNGTYTPVSNKSIMDLIEDKINSINLVIRSEEYRASTDTDGNIRGVIGAYNIVTPNENYGQRIMFRNSYDKSMSFAFVEGTVTWICENGCIKGDYEYKRVHRGVTEGDNSTTMQDVVSNIDTGIKFLQESFDSITNQMEELKQIEVAPTEVYDIVGSLWLEKKILNTVQMSVIKKELYFSDKFRHLGDKDFTAYDMYNHITGALKLSHPLNYISDHVTAHKFFEETFNLV